MKIALLGNCQTLVLTRCLKFYLPKAEITTVPAWDFAKRWPDRKSCLREVAAQDIVFLYRFGKEVWGEIDSESVRGAAKRAFYYPTITFPAYHPDIVYVVKKTGWGLVQTPMTDYNSALVLFGYMKKYSVDRTVALFERSVYQRVGYLDLWQVSVDEMLRSPEAEAYGLGNRILAWSRRGCFMHSSVHPKVWAVIDVARRMLELAGLEPRAEDPTPFIRDDLQDSAVWPLYPPIAERYGLMNGGYTFKRNTYGSDGRWPEFMSLPEFVRGSYDCYDAIGRDELLCDRVKQWIDKGTI